MVLNQIGEIAAACWLQIPEHFTNVTLHEFIIMPNHVHGIIEITVGAKNISPPNETDISNEQAKDISPQQYPDRISPINPTDQKNQTKDFSPENKRAKDISPQQSLIIKGTSKTIGSIVRGFKIGVTKWARKNTDINDIWQRNYYEHIIRNDNSYQNISLYIQNNPLNWNEDKFYH